MARNVLDTKEVKYFLSNMIVNDKEITLEWLLWVAFSRWPIERCFEIGKRDLGMDHFEMRNWQGIHRHFYITQLSMLFCSELQQKLREKNSRESVFDGRAGSPRRLCLDYGRVFAAQDSATLLSEGRGKNRILSIPQSTSPQIPLEKDSQTPAKTGHKCQQTKKLCAL